MGQRRVHGECFINCDNMKILIVLGIFWRLACSSKVETSYLPSYEVPSYEVPQHEYKQEQSYLPSYEVAQHEYVQPQHKYQHEPSYLSSYEVAQHEYVQPEHKYEPHVQHVAVQPHYVPQYDKGYIQPAATYPVATTIKGTGSAKFSGTGEAFFQG